ncbi:hypothetical protein B0H12DRAFT_1068563 [Mycena haematopus]|nr:hypothetical protein B0H12DRAFT_1068563 [Mycena haematopus]
MRGISTSGEGGILAPAPYASPPEANVRTRLLTRRLPSATRGRASSYSRERVASQVEEHPPRAYALGLRDERVWGYGFGDGSGISDIGSDFVRARLARWGACGITSRSSASGSSKFVRTTWAWGKRPCSKVYTTPQHIVRSPGAGLDVSLSLFFVWWGGELGEERVGATTGVRRPASRARGCGHARTTLWWVARTRTADAGGVNVTRAYYY